MIRARGDEEEEFRLPSDGNYLLAYSTLLGMKSFEDSRCGSFWMQLLCKELLESDGNSICDILTVVNQKLILEYNRQMKYYAAAYFCVLP